MADPALRLRHSAMLRALDEIDLLEVVAQELCAASDATEGRRLTIDNASVAAGTDLTTVTDLDGERICLMPTPSLQMICMAGLTAMAARELLPCSIVTAAIFGSTAVARLHVGLIARYVPNVSHIAVCPGDVGVERSTEWNVHDCLELAGIALSTETSSRYAALGANLLVIAELGWDRLDIEHLPPGVLLVNASRRDLPDGLLAGVDRVLVDDLGLVEHNQHRAFVRSHLAGSDSCADPVRPVREGWMRRPTSWRHRRRIENDLGHVLTGQGNRRVDADEVVLVELLGGESLETGLAAHIHRAARTLGLGRPVDDTEWE